MRLACWFRRRAETVFLLNCARSERWEAKGKVRDREDALARTRGACATLAGRDCRSYILEALIAPEKRRSICQRQSQLLKKRPQWKKISCRCRARTTLSSTSGTPNRPHIFTRRCLVFRVSLIPGRKRVRKIARAMRFVRKT